MLASSGCRRIVVASDEMLATVEPREKFLHHFRALANGEIAECQTTSSADVSFPRSTSAWFIAATEAKGRRRAQRAAMAECCRW